MKSIGVRLLRGLVAAVLAGGIAWIAAQLTIGMMLARYFTSAEQLILERIWLSGCVIAGFLVGGCYSPRWLTSQFRWMCWGAVAGLSGVMVFTRIPSVMFPDAAMRGVRIPGAGVTIDLETIGLISVPGALLAGGFVGWYFHRRCLKSQRCELASDQPGETP